MSERIEKYCITYHIAGYENDFAIELCDDSQAFMAAKFLTRSMSGADKIPENIQVWKFLCLVEEFLKC